MVNLAILKFKFDFCADEVRIGNEKILRFFKKLKISRKSKKKFKMPKFAKYF